MFVVIKKPSWLNFINVKSKFPTLQNKIETFYVFHIKSISHIKISPNQEQNKMESENPLYVFTTLALEQFLIIFDELQEEDKIPKSVDKDCLRQLMMDKILEGNNKTNKNDKNDEETLKNEIIEKSSPQPSPRETQTKSLLNPHQINLTINGDELDLPYLPQCVNYHCGGCINLKIRGGLYTPCMEPPLNGTKFCKACTKIVKEGKSEGTLKTAKTQAWECFEANVQTNKK